MLYSSTPLILLTPKKLNLKPNYVKENKKQEPPKKKRLITIEKIK